MERDMQKQDNDHDGDGSRLTFKLVGHANFIRTNPKSDRFRVKHFHHLEFWCTDAINVAQRFSYGLGMPITAKSDLSTGNMAHASYLLHSGDLNMLFTAPYSPSVAEIPMHNIHLTIQIIISSTASIPTFNYSAACAFSTSHGLAVRAIAVEVDDAEYSFNISISYGIQLFGDVVLRFISFKNSDPGVNFLPGFKGMKDGEPLASKDLDDFGIRGLDHVAGNVMNLAEVITYVKGYEMIKRSRHGFEFMPPPPPTYYKILKHRIGDNVLKDEQIIECEELGILVDKDDQGVLLQIFTKPVGDRPTVLVEIIQRIGCMAQDEEGNTVQKGGCGGFGKGNISVLFKSVEEYEKNIFPTS
ncbi:hypothetical protein MKX03_032771 [Papaver bracteatum]|nr:hypothetical protein MKX03_032771 [Papaver bracteatum]